MAVNEGGLRGLWKDDRDAKRVASVMIVALLLGGVFVGFALDTKATVLVGLLWASACSSVGWFLGFLFGIPRSLSTDTARTSAAGDLDVARKVLDTASAKASASRAAAEAASKAKDDAVAEAAARAKDLQDADDAAEKAAIAATERPDDLTLIALADAAKSGVAKTLIVSNAAAQAASDATQVVGLKLEEAMTDEAALTKAKEALPAAGPNPVVPPVAPSTAVNTNLEQISDWLTKIIVGVALVESEKVFAQMTKAAQLMAGSLGGPAFESFAFAILIYFSVSGLLGSYLLTRLFLQSAFTNAATGRSS